MSFRKRFLAGSLAAVMALGMMTGCTTVRKSDLSDDYSEVVAATYGDEKIYLDEVNYYLRNKQLMYEYYSAIYGANLLETEDAQNSLRTEAMSVIYQTRVLCDHASDYKVELTDDDRKLVQQTVEELLSSDNKTFLEVAGSDEEMLTELLTQNALANKVYDAIISQKEITTTEESVRRNSISYLLFSEEPEKSEEETEAAGETEAETVHDHDHDHESDEESEAAEETKYYTEEDANATLKKLQSGTSLEDVAKELDMDVNENNFAVNEEQTSEYGKAAVALKEGESAIAHVDNVGWYVMYCNTENDEEATATAYDDAVSKEKSEYFTEVYKELDKAKFKVNEDVIQLLDIADTPVYSTETEAETSEGETAEGSTEAGTAETTAGETEAETTETTAGNTEE